MRMLPLLALTAVLALPACLHSSVSFYFQEPVDTAPDGASIVRVGVVKPLGLGVYTSGGMESHSDPCEGGQIWATDPSIVQVVGLGTRGGDIMRIGVWNVTGLRVGRTTLVASCGDEGERQMEVEVRPLSACEPATAQTASALTTEAGCAQ